MRQIIADVHSNNSISTEIELCLLRTPEAGDAIELLTQNETLVCYVRLSLDKLCKILLNLGLVQRCHSVRKLGCLASLILANSRTNLKEKRVIRIYTSQHLNALVVLIVRHQKISSVAVRLICCDQLLNKRLHLIRI